MHIKLFKWAIGPFFMPIDYLQAFSFELAQSILHRFRALTVELLLTLLFPSILTTSLIELVLNLKGYKGRCV